MAKRLWEDNQFVGLTRFLTRIVCTVYFKYARSFIASFARSGLRFVAPSMEFINDISATTLLATRIGNRACIINGKLASLRERQPRKGMTKWQCSTMCNLVARRGAATTEIRVANARINKSTASHSKKFYLSAKKSYAYSIKIASWQETVSFTFPRVHVFNIFILPRISPRAKWEIIDFCSFSFK